MKLIYVLLIATHSALIISQFLTNLFESRGDIQTNVPINYDFNFIQSELGPSSTSISEQTAKYLIGYSAIAYCSKARIEAWSCLDCRNGTGAGFKDARYITSSNMATAAFAGVQPSIHAIVISFRGTDSLDDWVGNLMTLTEPIAVFGLSIVKVHSGFLEFYQSIQSEVRKNLVELISKYPDYPVVFTGHSLGGALASLAVYDVATWGVVPWNRTSLVTFGQPRVGNWDWSNVINANLAKSVRVTNQGDIVPNLPSTVVGYFHFNRRLHLQSNGESRWCPAESLDLRCGGAVSNLIKLTIPNSSNHKTFWDRLMNTKCEDRFQGKI